MIDNVEFNRECIIQGPIYKKGTIYLAGPIAHVDLERQVAWRAEAAEKLEAKGFKAVSPVGKSDWEGKLIIETDLKTVEWCTGMLAWQPPGIVSFGTACEIFYKAWTLGKPKKVVVWGQKNLRDPNKQSPFLYATVGHLCETLDEAIEYIMNNANRFRM